MELFPVRLQGMIPDNPTEEEVKEAMDLYCDKLDCRTRVKEAAVNGDPKAQEAMKAICIDEVIESIQEQFKGFVGQMRIGVERKDVQTDVEIKLVPEATLKVINLDYVITRDGDYLLGMEDTGGVALNGEAAKGIFKHAQCLLRAAAMAEIAEELAHEAGIPLGVQCVFEAGFRFDHKEGGLCSIHHWERLADQIIQRQPSHSFTRPQSAQR